MNKKNISIETKLSSKEIEKVLASIISNKVGFFAALSGKKYEGEIKGNNFKLNTIDDPSIELNGVFEENKIDFLIKWDSLKSSYKSLISVLGYTALGVALMILIKEYPNKIWTYVIVLLSLPMPYILAKVYLFFNYTEPNPKYIINRILKMVKGKIISDL